MTPVELYDTTLRDGAQGMGISFSVADKFKIAQRLDQLGVQYIEGGWPGATPKDTEFFATMQETPLHTATLTAFGSTRRAGIQPQEDAQLQGLLDARTSVITLVGKSWDRQVHDVLRTDTDENVRMVADTIAYLCTEGRRVFFDAEHFFDGYASNNDYALRVLDAAAQAGAERLILCDTNGGTLPHIIDGVTRTVVEKFGQTVGIHCHNDAGCAVADSLAAVRAGAVQVQGCVNGYGERTGNTNLCTLIPNLQLKMGIRVVSDEALANLTDTARYVAEVANNALPASAPYVGDSAFTHKGGQHVDAMMKADYAYQHIEPTIVGNSRRVVISDQSGKSTVIAKSVDGGIDVQDPELARKIAVQVKALEYQGYSFEGAEASFEMLIRRAQGYQPRFELIDFISLVEQRKGHVLVSEATLKLKVGDQIAHTAAEGNGPVNALDCALRKALVSYHPAVADITLHDYKVRVLDGHDGTRAVVRVLIESGNGQVRWSTVGCSTNIIEASWSALSDSIEYGLLLAEDASRAQAQNPAAAVSA
jgi:2-isopropylmalate synthase